MKQLAKKGVAADTTIKEFEAEIRIDYVSCNFNLCLHISENKRGLCHGASGERAK